MEQIKSAPKSAATLLREATKPEQCFDNINNITFRWKGQQW